MFLPEKATLSELNPGTLASGILPELWKGDTITVADAVSYFAGGKIVIVPKDGYEDAVAIPARPAAAVEAAVLDAVRQGTLWLLNGPASFQGEPVPAGVLTGAAQLRAPMKPIAVDQLGRCTSGDPQGCGRDSLAVPTLRHPGRRPESATRNSRCRQHAPRRGERRIAPQRVN